MLWSSDVVETAYRGAGFTEVMLVEGVDPNGVCARCACATATMTSVGRVVSGRFTAVENWKRRGHRNLCAWCVWAYRTGDLRRKALMVTRAPAALVVDVASGNLLAAGALGDNVALTIPTDGRKYLLPEARWGSIVVDGVPVSWSDDDSARLQAVNRLRRCGFGESAMSMREPPFDALRRVDSARWPQVFDDWSAIDVWRDARLWWAVAMRTTRSMASSSASMVDSV